MFDYLVVVTALVVLVVGCCDGVGDGFTFCLFLVVTWFCAYIVCALVNEYCLLAFVLLIYSCFRCFGVFLVRFLIFDFGYWNCHGILFDCYVCLCRLLIG